MYASFTLDINHPCRTYCSNFVVIWHVWIIEYNFHYPIHAAHVFFGTCRPQVFVKHLIWWFSVNSRIWWLLMPPSAPVRRRWRVRTSLKIRMRSSGDPHRGIYSEKKSGIQSEILSSILSGMRFGPGKPREPASSPQGSSPQNPTELASSLSVSWGLGVYSVRGVLWESRRLTW